MKERRNNLDGAFTLQIALSTGLISISAILLAIAAPTNTENAPRQDLNGFRLNESAGVDSITALGNYPDASILLSTDTTVTPDAAPTNTTSINVSTSTNFNGRLEGDPTTGVVRVTDAYPAGTYTVTVRAFTGGGQTATKTFTLTVTTPATCLPVSFAPATSFSAPLFPAYMAVGDFNGDGKQDLAVSNGGIGGPHTVWGSLYILLGNGAGHFTATNFNSLPFSHPSLVTVGDFNNDGAQDLAMLDEHSMWILLGDGAGNFPASTLFSTGGSGYPSSIAVGDFNGDGKQDLAVPNYGLNHVSILLGDGMGHFSTATNFGAGTGPGSVAVGDFNGDGKQDLAIANPNSANVSILLGDGAGYFSTATSFSTGPGSYSLAVGDFNRDGKQDLVTANRDSDNVSILLGNGMGGFSTATNFGAGDEAGSVAVGDFNGDGKQDLAVGNPPSTNVSLLLGDGIGSFSSPISLVANTGPYSLAVGDFNGDAKQDLAFSNPYSGNVLILLRDCASAPTPTPTATATATATASPTPAITPCPNALVFGENFDGVTAPALPAGWSAANPAGAAPFWVTSTDMPNTPPNAAFIDDPATVSDKRLDTPDIAINGQGAQVFFRNFYDLQGSPAPEVGFDGGVLEVSSPNINAGAFTDITDPAVGGSFVIGGYNATISTAFMSPIAGRMAWSGNSGSYIKTVANLGPSVVGHFIKLRFRMASDNTVGATGWRVDNVSVTVLCQSPSPTPSPTPTATATATATTTPSPSVTPAAQPLNLSARLLVQTGDNVGIGGFIITGTAPKLVLLRALGPSLAGSGVPNPLADPILELHGPPGFATIINDNWRDPSCPPCPPLCPPCTPPPSELAPPNDLESMIYLPLDPGAYTAIIRGHENAPTGVGLVELYDLNQQTDSKLANLSTRAFVSTGNDILIAGLILGGGVGNDRIVVRGIGPSLSDFGVPNALADPTLELRGGNGTLLLANNDWQDDPAQAAIISAAGLAPANVLESAIAATLPPGPYTVLLAGLNNGTGVGLVEVYDRGVTPSPR